MKELTIEATIENIPAVTDFVDNILAEAGCPLKVQMRIDVAVDELFGNIAHYAYTPDTGPVTVSVEIREDPAAAVITFADRGIPYNPLEAEEPDVTLNAADRPIGGLGIFLVRKSMDDIQYEFRDGQNILTITKYLAS